MVSCRWHLGAPPMRTRGGLRNPLWLGRLCRVFLRKYLRFRHLTSHRRAWRDNWPACVVVSGALTCIVREVAGSLGPTDGASTAEGHNRSQGSANGVGNLVAAVQPVALAVTAPTVCLNRRHRSPTQPELPSSTPLASLPGLPRPGAAHACCAAPSITVGRSDGFKHRSDLHFPKPPCSLTAFTHSLR